MKVLANREIS